MNSQPVLGIDFGTTNSVCAVLSGGDPEVLENADGARLTPSVVYYTKEGEQNRPLIGEQAENKAQDNPERVIRSIKREMGNQEKVVVDEDEYLVEEVAADIIRKLRTDAAEKLGVDREELTKAVITTPAYWESDRNQSVMNAAELAGFESVRTIKEPAAAAIAYGRFEPGLDKTVGVYDLGGGTFDFAIVDVDVGKEAGEGSEYNVIAQSGDPQLGGDDWDQRIVDWIVSNFEQKHGVSPLEPHHSDSEPFSHLIRQERIRSNARSAKEDLSNRATTEVNIRIPFLMQIGGESVDIDATLSTAQFKSMTTDLVEATTDPIYTAVEDAGESKSSFNGVDDIDDVILVGGSTRMPQVEELVKSIFQMNPKQRINPDEAVAAGAAVKANRDDILLLEVTPLSLGIGINGDRFKRMVHRNERLPARTTEVFTTSSEGATAVRIPIYQGERDIASENRHLKTLIIKGMAPGKRHSAHIEVTFEVQQNGRINVQAVENTRDKSVSVEIEGENRIPDEYIQKKIEDAKEMEEMDRRRRKVIEAQNEAQTAIKDAERLLSEFPQVFEEEEDEHMQKHVANVRNIRQDDTATLGELRDATEDLNEWVLEIGDRVRRTGARNRSGPTPGPATEIVDETDEDTNQGVQTDGPGQTVTNSETSSTPGTIGFGEVETDSDDTSESANIGGVPEDEELETGSSETNYSSEEGGSSTTGGDDYRTSADSEDAAETVTTETKDQEPTSGGDTGSTIEDGETQQESTDTGDGATGIVTPDDDPSDDDPYYDDRGEEVTEEDDSEGVMKMDDDGESLEQGIEGDWSNTVDESDEESDDAVPSGTTGGDGTDNLSDGEETIDEDQKPLADGSFDEDGENDEEDEEDNSEKVLLGDRENADKLEPDASDEEDDSDDDDSSSPGEQIGMI